MACATCGHCRHEPEPVVEFHARARMTNGLVVFIDRSDMTYGAHDGLFEIMVRRGFHDGGGHAVPGLTDRDGIAGWLTHAEVFDACAVIAAQTVS